MDHTSKGASTRTRASQTRLEELLREYWQLSSTVGRRPGAEPRTTQDVLSGLADVAGLAQFKSPKLEDAAASRLQTVTIGGRPKVVKKFGNVLPLRSFKPSVEAEAELEALMQDAAVALVL